MTAKFSCIVVYENRPTVVLDTASELSELTTRGHVARDGKERCSERVRVEAERGAADR